MSFLQQRQVSFKEAIVKALKENYCNFNGRSSRSEYWWFNLFMLIISYATTLIFCFNEIAELIATGVFCLAFILPSIGIAVRRLHDIGKSGWYYLLGLIPLIGSIILIVWYCRSSQPTPNKYGPVPNAA